jgi:hypothetical protein
MLANKQLYQLMNGMEGVVIDRDRVTAAGSAASSVPRP